MWIADSWHEIEVVLIALAVLCHMAVALICMAFTFAEGQITGRGWDAWRIAGLMLCLVWPVMLLVLALAQLVGHVRPVRAGQPKTSRHRYA